MLPVYEAISVTNIFEKGGHTKPWGVVVKTENGLKPYVAKLFEPPWIAKNDCVTNEVIGNILAQEFNLPVPQAAYIQFPKEFIHTLDDNLLQVVENRDDRLKFGSELVSGHVSFDHNVFDSSEAREIIQIDSVFAFDNLIRNPDRSFGRSNILTKSDSSFLIDHELAFQKLPHGIGDFISKEDWVFRKVQYHVFYNYLKKSWSSNKDQYFHEFGEYLKTLNVKTLIPYFKQLVNLGFSDSNHGNIVDYLKDMKHNYSNFVKLMGDIIS